MNKIRAYVDYNEQIKKHYYKDFKIIDFLPKIDNTIKYNDTVTQIESVELDSEQGSQNVYNYDYFKIIRTDYEDFNSDDNEDKTLNDYQYEEYVAVKIED